MISSALPFIFLFGVCVAQKNAANTCDSLKSCLDEANQCRQAAKSGGSLTDKAKAKLEKKYQLKGCDDATVQKIIDTLTDTKVKSQKRQELVAKCIGGDVSSFPGCPALPLPPADKLSRRSNANDADTENARPLKKGNQNGKCNKNNCKKDIGGCPEAKLCHQCYEISPLHDEIHSLQLSLQLQLAKCSGNFTVQHDSPMPDEEDSFGHALTS